MPRKTRFRRCSKGVSTVIGTIFLVLIALTVATNVFLWTFTQNATYNQAVKESSQMDAYRSSERIVASNTNYSIPQLGTIEVSVTVSNEGPISAQILTLWVLDENTKKYSFNDTLNINLNPGDTLPLTIRVAIPGVSSTGTFNGWLVTARGNRVPLESEREIIVAELAQGIGYLAMNFTSFKYYVVTGNQLGPPQSGFNIPNDENIVFSLHLTNLDEHHKNINLTGQSLLWLFSAAGAKTAKFPIAKVVGQTLVPFDFQVLEFGKSTKVFFGPDKATEVKGSLCAANLLLYGTIGHDDYGQNIPFVSIYVEA